MISQSTEYALRAIVLLARHQGDLLSTHRIAEETRVPSHYLSKVLQGLSRSGLVESRPGRSGGIVFPHDPRRVTVLQVVTAIDPLRRIRECPLGIHGKDLCPLHRRLDEAMEVAESALARSTIAELVAGSSPALCRPPAVRG